MHPGILYTKTVVPPADDAVVERLVRFSDILQDLQRSDAFSRRLTLVQAPAGFGKTTAVRNWITHSGKPAAWYAMDEQDHHPLTFWSYVMAAIGVIQPETVREPQAILMNPETDDPGDDSWTSWMVPFLNALMHAEDPFLIVIDDFHFASSPEITSAMAYLIEHLPSTVHVLITTRERPPWPIVKWQAKGWLTDVGKDRLRFSIPEADMLFEKRGVRVNPSLTEELVNWSEGWITGLELTLVSHLYGTMQPGHDALGHSDLGVKTLTAFLTEEVLRQLPGHLLDFMETSAVLHKFSPVMCDEVLERSDSQEVIRFLEEKQLFLVRLNDDGSWFRYHHIMGETLTDRLRQSDPAVIRRIHQRASDWLSRNGALHEAIHHADKAEDEGRVAQILHYHAESLTYSREPVAFIERINALSHERLRSFPELFAYSLFYRLLMKGHDGCDALINEARTLSCDNRQNQLVYEGMLDVLSFFYWTGHHAFDKARVYADSALEKLPQENYFWRMSAAVFSGDLLYYAGAPEEALPYFEEAHAMNLKHERHYFAISTELKKAVTFFELGRLSDARKTVASIEQLAEAHGFSGISKMGFVHTLEGELTREQGNLEEAARLHDKARSRLPDEHGLLAWHHLFEAKLRYSDGRVTDALQIINRILKPEQVNQIPRYMLLQASKRKLIYLMKLNRYDEAYALLDETGIRQGEGFPESPRPACHRPSRLESQGRNRYR
ncbi:MalT transcriptional regulator family protein [Salisediminibacterium selenitireducens]|uniref:ATP-binding protein n=1 Tax=Salisediminibacterium selenitireducens TaxID=85683 RepID=UPI00015F966B|nr:ATP-binding protein [Salisediminibacterium selenitireducens]